MEHLKNNFKIMKTFGIVWVIYFYCHCSDHKAMQHHEMMVLAAFGMVVGRMLQAVLMVKFHEYFHRHCYQLNKHRNQFKISRHKDLFTWFSCWWSTTTSTTSFQITKNSYCSTFRNFTQCCKLEEEKLQSSISFLFDLTSSFTGPKTERTSVKPPTV